MRNSNLENVEVSKEEEARYGELCAMALDFARTNQTDALFQMIKHGLNVNLKSHKGDTLLMLASYNGAFETTQMLISQGAKVDERNDRGQTPLAGACFKGNLAMVKLLVENGADVEANNGMGLTPYSFAVMFGRGEIAKYLLNRSPKPSLLKKLGAKVASFVGR